MEAKLCSVSLTVLIQFSGRDLLRLITFKIDLNGMLPGDNGVMASALACCAGSPGLIPIVKLHYSDDFSPSPV